MIYSGLQPNKEHPPANLAYGFCNGAEYPVGGRVKSGKCPARRNRETNARGG